MKPIVLYQEHRYANTISELLKDDSVDYRTSGDWIYQLRVTVTRYDEEATILKISTCNRPSTDGWETIYNLLAAYTPDFQAIREGIQAFDAALGQFERPEEFDLEIEPD